MHGQQNIKKEECNIPCVNQFREYNNWKEN